MSKLFPSTCPNCNYVRLPADTAPDWQCPSCERAYNKAAGAPLDESYGRHAVPTVNTSRGGGVFKWIFVVAILATGIGFFTSFGGTNAARAGPSSAQEAQPPVILYATAWCGYCAATRQLFAANGIQYTELDIEKSSDAAEAHRRLGGNGVPLIVVGDDIVKGYNEAQLRNLLRPWMNRS